MLIVTNKANAGRADSVWVGAAAEYVDCSVKPGRVYHDKSLARSLSGFCRAIDNVHRKTFQTLKRN